MKMNDFPGGYCERLGSYCTDLCDDGTCPGCVLDVDEPVYLPEFDCFGIEEDFEIGEFD